MGSASPKFFGTPYTDAQMVWPRTTKFSMETHVGRGVFLGVGHAPQLGGAEPKRR